MGRKIDLTGQTFGRLTVLEEVGRTDRGDITWKCLCNCGRETIVVGYSLRLGRTKSCGCLRIESATTHGHRHSRLYQIWIGMISRCKYPKQNNFEYYGAKGVTVYSRWEIFENFKLDVEAEYISHVEKYGEKNTTLDRIDPDGNYIPENVRWTTRTIQERNKGMSKRNTSGHKGVSWNRQCSKWRSHIGISGKTKHLGQFDSLEDAVAARKAAEEKYWGDDR